MSNKFEIRNRNTGRTTRMIDHAIELLKQGKRVHLMFHSRSHADFFKERLKQYPELKLLSPTDGAFDWNRMRLLGSHPSEEFLIDHYALSQRYYDILEMYHRFDVDNVTKETEK